MHQAPAGSLAAWLSGGGNGFNWMLYLVVAAFAA